MTTTLPVLHRKRKLSISGPATKQTLIKKFKEEIEAEKRKKVRLEWYLKQLLLEKELLVKENEIEFANAMQSLGDTDALVGRPPLSASAMTTTTPAAPVPTSEDAPSTSSVSVPTIVLPTADFLPSSSLLFGDNSGLPGSSSSSSLSAKFDNPFFAVPPPAPLTPSSAPAVPPVTSVASKAEQEDPCTVFFDDLSLFAAKYDHDDAKPSTSAEEPSAFFSAEWEQTHCWWADEELSQILAVPPSLMV